ncbi:MAG: hypothetical protein ABW127_11360 [Candidatus Thiodiazotropha endolucinida]
MSLSIEDFLHPWLNAYVTSPQWVKSILGRAYRGLPVAFRRGRRFVSFKREIVEGAASKGEFGRRKLAATLHWAIETVPAYRQYQDLIGSVAAHPLQVLNELPILKKEDIKKDPSSYLSRSMPASTRLKMFTGGSTANPMMFYLHKGVSRPREYAFMDDFHSRVGLTDDDIVLALRGRTVPTAGKPSGRIWMYEPIKRQLILSTDHLERRWMPKYAEALRKWRPRFIQAFPSALYPVARWLAENPMPELATRLRGVLLYSENIYGFQMDLFKAVFGCPVLKHYGHSERVLMAASMPDDGRYFFWPQYGHFELLDINGNQVTQPGVLGEIVGTSFDNLVMPFLRYRTGDMAMLSTGPEHPALPGYAPVERIEGCLQEFLVCHDSRLVSISTMGAAHFGQLAEVDEMQYEQHQPGHFNLKVVTRKPLSESAKQDIEHAVIAKTQGGCSVTVIEVAAIERTARGKNRMLIQHLDITQYLVGRRCI